MAQFYQDKVKFNQVYQDEFYQAECITALYQF